MHDGMPRQHGTLHGYALPEWGPALSPPRCPLKDTNALYSDPHRPFDCLLLVVSEWPSSSMLDHHSPTVDERVSSQSHRPLALGLCIALLILNVAAGIRINTQCWLYKCHFAQKYALRVSLIFDSLVSIAP
ncbi:hypothetical protein BO86DRAFT_140838 [Aspergillus japonicus CBS 114.51]|uniref:Uncharacterized protein n=1 Tax=Aspergillus japonicus CBS 114.51 TaxID=1448312 RepID=A0A8T8XEH8_ASPJA|nr:hypothetical protein BO86DRAFT_140838 [Aspergillus japonicus CBS 114.51]RAH86234.1 hypothetical protein BO86DRAFT_140838 [Aspergillus japonicus CBS 114.51]